MEIGKQPESFHSRVRDFVAKNSERPWHPGEVAEKLKVSTDKVSTALTQLFKAGRLSRCEITVPGKRSTFEYRDKGYEKPDEFKALKPAKDTIIQRAPSAPATYIDGTPVRDTTPAATEGHPGEGQPSQGKTGPKNVNPAPRNSMPMGRITPPPAPASSVRNQGERFAPGLGAKETIDREPALPDRTAAFQISDDGHLGISVPSCDVEVFITAADIAVMMTFLGKTEALWRDA